MQRQTSTDAVLPARGLNADRHSEVIMSDYVGGWMLSVVVQASTVLFDPLCQVEE